MILFSVLKMHMGGLSARLEYIAVPATGEWSVHWKLEGLGTANTPGHQQHLDKSKKPPSNVQVGKTFEASPEIARTAVGWISPSLHTLNPIPLCINSH